MRVSATLTERGQPVVNELLTVKAYSSHGIRQCTFQTGRNGSGSCNVVNAIPLSGYDVVVQVISSYNGYFLTAFSSYIE